jgi:hypothetical protein
MKAIIVYKDGAQIVEEQNLQREIRKLQENKIEIICILHISFAIQIRNLEFPKNHVNL